MKPLKESRVALTGASGFFGRHVFRTLLGAGVGHVTPISRSTGVDLRDGVETEKAFRRAEPDIIVHLAATVGGIGANMARPGTFFSDNMWMGMNVVEAAVQAKARLIFVSTVCAYPKYCPIPFKEKDLWNGYPEETNAPYGIAKRTLLVMCQAFRKEFGLRFGCLIPTNLYGPGDHFEDEKTSHVIPALIRRFYEAKVGGATSVTCWGTGAATRSFLFVSDASQAIVRACEVLDDDEPINLPGSDEVSMLRLVEAISELVGYEGHIHWDTSKPDGQPRRASDGTRAREILGWEPKTSLVQGLKEAIEWYATERKKKR